MRPLRIAFVSGALKRKVMVKAIRFLGASLIVRTIGILDRYSGRPAVRHGAPQGEKKNNQNLKPTKTCVAP